MRKHYDLISNLILLVVVALATIGLIARLDYQFLLRHNLWPNLLGDINGPFAPVTRFTALVLIFNVLSVLAMKLRNGPCVALFGSVSSLLAFFALKAYVLRTIPGAEFLPPLSGFGDLSAGFSGELPTSPPGSLCAIVCCITTALLCYKHLRSARTEGKSFLQAKAWAIEAAAVGGAMMIVISIAALLSRIFLFYYPGSTLLYYVGQMSWATATLYLLFSFGFVVWLKQVQLQNQFSPQHQMRLQTGVFIAVISLIACLFFTSGMKQADIINVRSQVSNYTQNIAVRFEQGLNERAKSLKRLTSRWNLAGGLSRVQFENDAKAYMRDFPGLNNIGWADQNFVVRWVVPEALGKKLIGMRVDRDPTRALSYYQARESGQIVMTPPLRLILGGCGFLLISPLKTDIARSGFLAEIFVFDELLPTAKILKDDDYGVQVSENGQPVYVKNPDSTSASGLKNSFWAGSHRMSIMNHDFLINAAPSQSTLLALESRAADDALLVGAFICHLMAVAFLFAIRAVQEAETNFELARFQKVLLDNADFAIVSTDHRGLITSCNAGALQLSGLKSEDLVGTPIQDHIVIEETVNPLASQTWAAAFQGHPANLLKVEARWQLKKDPAGGPKAAGSIPIEVSLNAVEGTPGDNRKPEMKPGFICVAQDMSLKKNQTRLLEEQRVKLAASAKMVSLGEMAGGIAHEINNPLAILQGRADQISSLLDQTRVEKQLPGDAVKIREACDKIQTTVQRIATIITGLRRFARDGGGDPFHSAFISEVIRETIALCQKKFTAAGIELKVALPEHEEPVFCRPVQISQVLLNLLSNAAYSVEQNPIRIIEVRLEQNESGTGLSVLDSGPGVPHEIRDKIFEPFFTTKPLGEGTGLGLSISKGIIEEHGGCLKYDWTKDHRSCFQAYFPRSSAGLPSTL